MARAQTYIITDSQVYGYSSDSHYDNHKSHLNRFYKNLKVTEYIPLLLSKEGNTLIDINRHGNNGVIYLPNILLNFQCNWLLDRSKYLSKFTWNLNDIVNNKYVPYDQLNYDEVVKIIKRKTTL